MKWPEGLGTDHTRVTSVFRCPPGWQTNDEFVYVGLPGYMPGTGPKGDPTDLALFGKPWRLVPRDGIPGSWRQPYISYLVGLIESDPIFAGAVAALHGKTLVCFCKGKRGGRGDLEWCHADMLALCAERLFHLLG